MIVIRTSHTIVGGIGGGTPTHTNILFIIITCIIIVALHLKVRDLLAWLRTISRLPRFPQLLGATQQVLCIFLQSLFWWNFLLRTKWKFDRSSKECDVNILRLLSLVNIKAPPPQFQHGEMGHLHTHKQDGLVSITSILQHHQMSSSFIRTPPTFWPNCFCTFLAFLILFGNFGLPELPAWWSVGVLSQEQSACQISPPFPASELFAPKLLQDEDVVGNSSVAIAQSEHTILDTEHQF